MTYRALASFYHHEDVPIPCIEPLRLRHMLNDRYKLQSTYTYRYVAFGKYFVKREKIHLALKFLYFRKYFL